MTKVTLDLRPVDTENVVRTRNRIRLCSFLNIFGIFLYLSAQSSLTGAHVSWIHLLHIVFDPIIIFTTVADVSSFVFGSLICSVAMILVDGGISTLNFISISRCIGEASAACFERLIEKGFLLFLAIWLAFFGLIGATQLYQLKVQLEEKDVTEKYLRKKQRQEKNVPSWNSAAMYSNKIRLISLFLILFDIVYAIGIAMLIEDAPMLILGAIHLVLDPFVYFYISKSVEVGVYNIVRIAYSISAISNLICLTLLIQLSLDTVGKLLCTMIAVVYLITDMIQVLYSSSVVTTIQNQKKFKDSL